MSKAPRRKGPNHKVQPRLAPLMHEYLDDLAALEILGKTKTQVAQRFIEDGVTEALKGGLIKLRKPSR